MTPSNDHVDVYDSDLFLLSLDSGFRVQMFGVLIVMLDALDALHLNIKMVYHFMR